MQEVCFAEEIQKDAKALRAVLPVYAGRSGMLTAVLQYVYQAIKLGGSGKELEGRALEAIAGEKLRDFETLGTLITRLGANPVFTACPPYPVSYHSAAGVDYAKTYSEMLAADIRLEQHLIEQFDAIIEALEGNCAAEIICHLSESSRMHLTRLEELLTET